MDTPFGISTKLPPMPEENVEPPEINERNILLVLVNTQNQLLINNEFNDITTLKNRVKRFVTKDADNPKKAIVSLRDLANCLQQYGFHGFPGGLQNRNRAGQHHHSGNGRSTTPGYD